MTVKNGSKIDLSLLAYCGLYCGACSFKVAVREKNRGHLHALPQKYDHLKNMELEAECLGCRNDEMCGDCTQYPCELINKFASDGVPHHGEVLKNIENARKIGVEKWLAGEKQAYSCG